MGNHAVQSKHTLAAINRIHCDKHCVFSPLLLLEQVNAVSCCLTQRERVVCLIWALSGWGSRLYSLVGGTAPCSGDNYTVYCLPWGAPWTLLNGATLKAKDHIYSWIPGNMMGCSALTMHWLNLSNGWLKKYEHLNKVILASHRVSESQWMRACCCLSPAEILMVWLFLCTAVAI